MPGKVRRAASDPVMSDMESSVTTPSHAHRSRSEEPREDPSTAIHDLIAEARDTITVRRVFGDPYEKDGVTIIPAATVLGGLGGGVGNSDSGESHGGGGGGGVMAWPSGAYVLREGEVTWQPALNLNLVILGGQLVGLVTVLALRSLFEARRRA
ncbi:MAG TPA: spore germination protein GerW family protein [Chloroflexota bacterium]|nr:spore germination protein GerW family protein [Chloroflexota bacterium]